MQSNVTQCLQLKTDTRFCVNSCMEFLHALLDFHWSFRRLCVVKNARSGVVASDRLIFSFFSSFAQVTSHLTCNICFASTSNKMPISTMCEKPAVLINGDLVWEKFCTSFSPATSRRDSGLWAQLSRLTPLLEKQHYFECICAVHGPCFVIDLLYMYVYVYEYKYI